MQATMNHWLDILIDLQKSPIVTFQGSKPGHVGRTVRIYMGFKM